MRDAVSGKRERQERFAKELRALRAEAGNPSFRVMAARSHSVSHATLHEAAKGTRFPSWLTTEAFVEACGGDVGDWRTRWREALGEPETTLEVPDAPLGTSAVPLVPVPPGDAVGDAPVDDSADNSVDDSVAHDVPADDALTAGPAVDDLPADGPAGQGSAASSAPGDSEPPVEPVLVRRSSRRRRRTALVVAGCAAALTAAGTAVHLQTSHDQRTPVRAKPGPQPTAAPVFTSAEGTVPRIAGDKSVFVADVTIPDGTVVAPGQQFTKTWEIANIGTVPWHGRFLERAPLPADNGTCSTPGKVRIPDTEPGAHVRISVAVMAPDDPGSCWVGWKMVDGEDRPFLPGSRPIYFVVNVAG
ncbi:NBR1-Ig-like domain-containing protein [Planotetraspora kaengkrachanensis]|uniref:Nbr1 FW domain-containing protein n=1 Tax=Planotetraspora kaengkrachanensis TaxID=575193 RepID=A0A8J3VCU7_9ACTN|nr:NBR1-Ig-like domain-containing protein [Planotetraspora kaengkrachanensis]GIG84824.1 hypothetical protein Pka01_79510 [Planotetraspora kaengkrachanensis]